MASDHIKLRFDWMESMGQLGDAERGRLVLSLLRYGATGVADELSGNERYLFAILKAQIDRDRETSKVRAKSGQAGGQATQSKAKQDQASLDLLNQKSSKIKQSQAKSSKASAEKKETREEEKRERSKERKEEENREKRDYITPPSPPTAAELPVFGPELAQAVQDWLAYKRERRETYKPVGFKSLLTQITRAAAQYGEAAVSDAIRQAIANGYRGIVWDALRRGQTSGGGNVFADMLREEETLF